MIQENSSRQTAEGLGASRISALNRQDLARSDIQQYRVTKLDTKSLKTNDSAVNQKMMVGETSFRGLDRAPQNISPYQQLRTQMRQQGQGVKPAVASRRASLSMFKAGTSPQAIKSALSRQNPKMSNAQFNAYFRKNIQPALRSRKAIEGRKQMAAFKQKHGIPQRYTRIEGLKKVQAHYKGQQIAKAKEISKKNHQSVADNRLGGHKSRANDNRKAAASNRMQSKPAQKSVQAQTNQPKVSQSKISQSRTNQIKAARARAASLNTSTKSMSRGRKR